MADYAIITDVGGDIPPSIVEQYGIITLPMNINLGDRSFYHYYDYREMPASEFYAQLRSGKSATTAAVAPSKWAEALEAELGEGRDAFCMPFSSTLSATYENAAATVAEIAPRYPDRTILLIDTLSATMGAALIIRQAARNRENGVSLADNFAMSEDLKRRTHLYFTVDDLAHLRRGGRISAATAVIGAALGIKPILVLSAQGVIESINKARGRRNALKMLGDYMAQLATDPENDPVMIAHAGNPEGAEELAAELRSRFGTKDIVIGEIGPVIGAHTGLGALVLNFIGKPKE